jgi:hypothetical protein
MKKLLIFATLLATTGAASGQTGPGENGFQADDTLWFSHGRAANRVPDE